MAAILSRPQWVNQLTYLRALKHQILKQSSQQNDIKTVRPWEMEQLWGIWMLETELQ